MEIRLQIMEKVFVVDFFVNPLLVPSVCGFTSDGFVVYWYVIILDHIVYKLRYQVINFYGIDFHKCGCAILLILGARPKKATSPASIWIFFSFFRSCFVFFKCFHHIKCNNNITIALYNFNSLRGGSRSDIYVSVCICYRVISIPCAFDLYWLYTADTSNRP